MRFKQCFLNHAQKKIRGWPGAHARVCAKTVAGFMEKQKST